MTVTEPESDDVITATASCPEGKEILGGGAHLTTSNSNDLKKVDLTSSYPSSGSTWTAIASVQSDLSSGRTATLQAFALCSE